MTSNPAPPAHAVRPLAADEEAVVRSLPLLIYALPRAIDGAMTQEQNMSATEYLALMHLSEAPDRRLRMGDLSSACEMSLSGTTRIVHRLEKDGYIRRVRCDHDGRSYHAALTESGFARLEQAWPSNLAAVRRHFLDHLTDIDLKTFAAALRKVAT
ncbi:MarR family winged helix-turn-helix transcriptional regulator [Streptomyces nigra]|uniref:MarR family winged helix-turn-helix transcriptional regulator n=1 Tax=Streptomyces nigra TaxID=1827580 RepID=UPI0035DBCE64